MNRQTAGLYAHFAPFSRRRKKERLIVARNKWRWATLTRSRKGRRRKKKAMAEEEEEEEEEATYFLPLILLLPTQYFFTPSFDGCRKGEKAGNFSLAMDENDGGGAPIKSFPAFSFLRCGITKDLFCGELRKLIGGTQIRVGEGKKVSLYSLMMAVSSSVLQGKSSSDTLYIVCMRFFRYYITCLRNIGTARRSIYHSLVALAAESSLV